MRVDGEPQTDEGRVLNGIRGAEKVAEVLGLEDGWTLPEE